MARLGKSRARKNRSGGRSYGRSRATIKGWNALERRLAACSKASDVDAGLKTEASDGVTYSRSGEKPEHRSAGDNAKIWNRQKKDGRNPFKYDEDKGTKLWRDGANRVIGKDAGGLKAAGKKVADYMRKTVVKNISMGRDMAPLDKRYAAWKRKKFGGKAILVRSGQLLRALKPIVIEFK